MLVVQFPQTGTESSPSFLDSLVVQPCVVAKSLGHRIVWTISKAVILGQPISGRLEHIMGSGDLK